MIAGIIDSSDNTKYWESALGGSFDCAVADDTGRLPACDIILVSQEYCCGAIGQVISSIRSSERLRSIPAAAVTSDPSCENQEILLAMGFDDIIRMPVCDSLLLRRTKALAAVPLRETAEAGSSFDRLLSFSDHEAGAFCVRSVEFTSIFRFVMRLLERSGSSAQMLVMSLSCAEDRGSELRKKNMNILSEAVRLCLRRGDMASVCGDNRIIVLLVGADDDGGHLVASRIVSCFYSECEDGAFELSYDLREVSGKR